MAKIYIVLTYTGTWLSRVVRAYTKDEFAHVSIALDSSLSEMYSFGRLRAYDPIFAGFVREYLDRGTFKRFYKTTAKIYSLEITEKQKEKVKELIYTMRDNKYGFNYIGLVATLFHKRIQIKNTFYCSEFVKYVLEKAKISKNLPELVKPESFKDLTGAKVIYSGFLNQYKMGN